MSELSMLVGKKTLAKLGSQMNDNAGSKVSSFAMRQMEKMGWSEGKGLGKTESGIVDHIKVAKREDAAGLGTEALKTEVMEASETWWHDAFAVNLKKITAKHEKKSKSSKKRKAEEVEVSEKPPSYDELFKATGGARMGMRARAEQKGKWKRTEDLEQKDKDVIALNGGVTAPVDATLCQNDSANTAPAEVSTSSSTDDEQVGKKAGKEKKAKKEKKEKKEKKPTDEADGKKEEKSKKSKKDKRDK